MGGRSPQYSIISPLESPQDSPEGLLEGLQKLSCGGHPGLIPINETSEKLVSHLFNGPKSVGPRISNSCVLLPTRRSRSLNPRAFKRPQGPRTPQKPWKSLFEAIFPPSSRWYSQNLWILTYPCSHSNTETNKKLPYGSCSFVQWPRMGSTFKVVQHPEVPFCWSPTWPLDALMGLVWPYIATYMALYMALGALYGLITLHSPL